MSTTGGAYASFAVAFLSMAALVVGIALISVLGGSSGQDLGAGASAAAFASAVPLLVTAELLKILSAAAEAIVVWVIARVSRKGGGAVPLIGYGGAALLAASGLVGLYAVAQQTSAMGKLISNLGFFGIALTGLWIITVLLTGTVRTARWHAAVGYGAGAAALASLLFPPLALVSAPLGWIWWIGLGLTLKKKGGDQPA